MSEKHPSHKHSPATKGFVDDFKKAVLDAIEVLKFNKTKTEAVMKAPESTKFAWIFLVAPAAINIVLLAIMSKGFFGYMLGSYIMSPLSIIASIYVAHFVTVKFFKGKGDLNEYFRIIGYVNALQLLLVPISILLLLGIYVYQLLSLVYLAAGIYTLILTYNILKTHYKIKSQDVIIVMIITIFGVGIASALLQNILFPNPWDEFAHEMKKIYR